MLRQYDIHDANLVFRGFKPSAEEANTLKSMLFELQEKGPSESTVRLKIRRKKGVYKVFLELKSPVVSFRATGHSKALESSANQAISWIEAQLERWKKKRWRKPPKSLDFSYSMPLKRA